MLKTVVTLYAEKKIWKTRLSNTCTYQEILDYFLGQEFEGAGKVTKVKIQKIKKKI